MSGWAIPYNLRAEVSRVLGFPATLSAASIQTGYPAYASELSIYQPYAILQNKLTFLTNAPAEAVMIFGAMHPAFSGYYVTASLLLQLTTPSGIADGTVLELFAGSVPLATATAGGSDTPTTMVEQLIAALAGNGTVIASAAAADLTLYATVAGKYGNGTPVLLVSSSATLLVNGAQACSGALNGGMDPPGPWEIDESLSAPVFGYMPIIYLLASDLGSTRLRLTAKVAGDVVPRPTELAERDALLRRYRRELADLLGVPLDPDIVGNRRRGQRMQRIV
jgi:hypothetical protein